MEDMTGRKVWLLWVLRRQQSVRINRNLFEKFSLLTSPSFIPVWFTLRNYQYSCIVIIILVLILKTLRQEVTQSNKILLFTQNIYSLMVYSKKSYNKN